MIDLFKLLLFITYSTIIFFLPNNKFILIFVFLTILLNILNIKNISKVIKNIFIVIPFILFTFLINLLLDSCIYAIWISVKLLIVCNATFIYSSNTTTLKIANTIELLFHPLKLFKIDTSQIKVMVCIALSMIPILKNEFIEIKNVCKAKNININIKNMKYILSKFLLSLIMRVNQIEESLKSKGYTY